MKRFIFYRNDRLGDFIIITSIINKLKKGMNYTKVVELAGEPYKKKLTKDSTEVWIYVTNIPQTTFSKSPKDLSNDYKTAVVFKDEILVGWGEEYKKLLN